MRRDTAILTLTCALGVGLAGGSWCQVTETGDPDRTTSRAADFGLLMRERLPPSGPDARSTVRFQYSCRSTLSRRDVTLFANGTVRLREGLLEEQELYLDELGPAELASTLRRLEQLQTSSERPVSSPYGPSSGDWVSECRIRLELAGLEPWSYRFSEHEVPPILVSSLIQVADDLADETGLPALPERVPAAYEASPGDVLRTAEGERFRVLRRTADGRGLELEGLDVPVRMIVEIDSLPEAFVAVESRR